MLEAQTTGALPGYGSFDAITVADGGTLAVAIGGTGDWQSGDIDNLLANVQFSAGTSLGIDTSDGAFSYGTDIHDNAGDPIGLVTLGYNSLTLTGANALTEIDVAGGTLELDSSAALDNGNAAIVLNGGMLQAMAGLDLANPITLEQAGSTFDTNGCTVELDGQISGNGGLIVIDSRNGYGTLFLTGENTYLGTADLEAGTLQLGNPNALGPGSGSLTVNGGELDIDGQSITVGLLGGDGGVITNSDVLDAKHAHGRSRQQRGLLWRHSGRQQPGLRQPVRQRRACRRGQQPVFRGHRPFQRPLGGDERQRSAQRRGAGGRRRRGCALRPKPGRFTPGRSGAWREFAWRRQFRADCALRADHTGPANRADHE